MKRTRNISTTLLLLSLLLGLSHSAWAQTATVKVRAGYDIGGPMPLSMPATLRSINRFYPTSCFRLGADVQPTLRDRWGLLTGLYLENKALDTHVTTKAYHMLLQMDGNELEGVYTGRVKLSVKQWMLTLPLQATWQLSEKVLLKGGPYASLLLSKGFEGYVYDGYLRKDDPTGPKVEMGHGKGSRGTFDFPDEVRRLQMGLDVGADWDFSSRWGAYADLAWGLTGLLKSSFKTVEQTLYPIYLSVGMTYKVTR